MPEIANPSSEGTQAPATHRSRWIALVVLCVGALMIILDAIEAR